MRVNRKTVWFILIWAIFGILFIYWMPKYNSSREIINYLVLMVSYFLVPIIFAISIKEKRFDIFDPINMFFTLYFLMYTITPLILMIQDNTMCFGIDVMDGCAKATIIYIISFFVLIISYKTSFRKRRNNVPETNKDFNDERIVIKKPRNIAVIAFIGWFVCYLISLIYLFQTGRSLTYILSLGLLGSTTDSTELSIGFLENISYGMIGFWLYYCISSKNKIAKSAMAFLMATAYMIRGFRFVVIIMIVAYFIMIYVKKRRRPNIGKVSVLLVFFLVFISILGFIRNDLRLGNAYNLHEFGIDDITYALYSNFNIYQIYYGAVSTIPGKIKFAGIKMFTDSLAIFIPRIIWKSKPLAEEHIQFKLIAKSVSDFAIYHAHMASPDLGAYYMQCGTLGCIVYSFVWGKICKIARDSFENNLNNINILIAYSIFVPSLMQMIIRGGDVFDILRKIGFFFIPSLVMIIYQKSVHYKR